MLGCAAASSRRPLSLWDAMDRRAALAMTKFLPLFVADAICRAWPRRPLLPNQPGAPLVLFINHIKLAIGGIVLWRHEVAPLIFRSGTISRGSSGGSPRCTPLRRRQAARHAARGAAGAGPGGGGAPEDGAPTVGHSAGAGAADRVPDGAGRDAAGAARRSRDAGAARRLAAGRAHLAAAVAQARPGRCPRCCACRPGRASRPPRVKPPSWSRVKPARVAWIAAGRRAPAAAPGGRAVGADALLAAFS